MIMFKNLVIGTFLNLLKNEYETTSIGYPDTCDFHKRLSNIFDNIGKYTKVNNSNVKQKSKLSITYTFSIIYGKTIHVY